MFAPTLVLLNCINFCMFFGTQFKKVRLFCSDALYYVFKILSSAVIIDRLKCSTRLNV
jgi:hypothetical protein